MVRFGRLTRSVRYNDNDNDLETELGTSLSKDFDLESKNSLSKELESVLDTGRSKDFDLESNTSLSRSMLNRKIPIQISHGSSLRDDRRFSTPVQRYYPNSPKSNIESNEQPLPSPQVSPTSPDRNTKSKEQPPPSQQVSPMSNHQCDTSDEVSPCTYEDESSIEDSTKSEDSDDHSSLSISNYDQLTIAYAKHQMMVALMEEFYTNFDPQWQTNVRSHVAPSSRSSRSCANSSKPQNSSRQDSNGKRAMRDREPSPDDNANNGKKRRENPTDARGDEPDPQFACPFRKHDPRKYCSNLDTGTKYRSCIGPGFSTISKLK